MLGSRAGRCFLLPAPASTAQLLDMSLLLGLGTDGVGSPWEEAGQGILCFTALLWPWQAQRRGDSGSQDTLSECAAGGDGGVLFCFFFPLCMGT